MVRIKSISKWQGILITIFIGLFIFLTGNEHVEAEQTVNRMKITINLDKNGTAFISENWNVSADEGSEIYKTLKLEGPQQLGNYSVSIDGKPMKRTSNWNPDASKKAKAGRYGQNGNELNWGITKYGTHNYNIKYAISNFVEQTKTKQMINWTFLEHDVEISPHNIAIRIQDQNHKFSKDNGYGIWGFGFDGQTQFNKRGQIDVNNSKALNDDNYVKILMEIPKGTYKTSYHLNKSFDSVVKDAFKGSDFNYQDYKSGKNIKNDLLDRILWVVIGALSLIGILFVIWLVLGIRNYSRYYPRMKKLQKQNEGQYSRQITANNIFELYTILSFIPGNRQKQDNNFLTAALLQLVKQGNIKQETVKEKSHFVLLQQPEKDAPEPLQALYTVLYRVEKDNVVTESALSKYLSHDSNWQELTYEFSDYSYAYCMKYSLVESSADALKTRNKKDRKAIRWAKWLLNDNHQLTEEGIKIRTQIVQLKNYLEEFSLLNERNIKEVSLWDDYMLAAAALGILDKVEEQLNKVYPEYAQESIYYNTSDHPFNYTANFSSHVAYSSTGGGGSTSSGGGGSSGGSSGGGGFR
ncbi:DUF2207 family protein [Ligilactobacillus acidipiscis]|uniref:DUF2207 family protein n=1 Tax=Ligilactobacillus acidipiscis TaxID=89059 RepID=UPI0022DEA90E|nr:DUF2207 domain-containing protein [Ligilactobacillus acidipiscis]